MADDLPSFLSNHCSACADRAATLAVVAATVPLPPANLQALRLVCRATKRAVDQSIAELHLSPDSAKGLRALHNPLTSRLTALTLKPPGPQGYSKYSFENACAIAKNNSQSIESLLLLPFEVTKLGCSPYSALRSLGSLEWPQLRTFQGYCHGYCFDELVNLAAKPVLTVLILRGILTDSCFTALCCHQLFFANVEVLDLSNTGLFIKNSMNFQNAMKSILQRAKRLRCLALAVQVFTSPSDRFHLGFLTAAELPNLEELHLRSLGSQDNLSPICTVIRPRLRTLSLSGYDVERNSLLTVIASSADTFPVLEDLILSLSSSDWSFMREIGLPTLKSLTLHPSYVSIRHVANMAAALPRLPALETLYFTPGFETSGTERALETLFSGPALPRLRSFKKGSACKDSDGSLKRLIGCADKIPELQELIMEEGRISPDGFAALAAVGRQGQWPHLK